MTHTLDLSNRALARLILLPVLAAGPLACVGTEASPEPTTPTRTGPSDVNDDNFYNDRSETRSRSSASEATRPLPPTPPAPTSAPPPPSRDLNGDQSAPNTRPTPTPPPEQPSSSRPDHQAVIAFVERLPGLDGWEVVTLGHFRRARRHVVVAWPAINANGRLVDATVVAVPVRETIGGELEEDGRRWVVREAGPARAALTEYLRGDDYEVLGRNAGVPLNDLGPSLSRLAAAFVAARRSGDHAAAGRAATDFSELLPIGRAAHESSVARLLWMAASQNASLEHVETRRTGNRAALQLRVLRGNFALRTIRATAEPTPGNSMLWLITDYDE